MKKIITSNISTGVGMPIKSGTLDHLQSAYIEALSAMARSLWGQRSYSGQVMVLYGCEYTGNGSTAFSCNEGFVYYNGIVYYLPATSFTLSNTAVANISTSYFTDATADPVTFTDGINRNVHEIKTIAITDATSGTGVSDFNNFLRTSIDLVTLKGGTLGANYTIKFNQDRAIYFNATTGVDFNIIFDTTDAIPGSVTRLKVTMPIDANLTITQGAGQTVIREAGDPTSVANATIIIYFVYVGKNYANNHEISYTLKNLG